ncbi:beta-lactamase family protein [Maricaulaceae bacterium NA33B04]|nr:beta-lactamase family protein [Maricaulaceae bacterium NA33B04]
MKAALALTAVLPLMLAACSGADEGPIQRGPVSSSSESPASADERHAISMAVEQAASQLNGAGMTFMVLGPAQSHSGSVDSSGGQRSYDDSPLRIASNTKTFVAVAALKLLESGALELDRPIRSDLPARLVSLLESGGYDLDAITLRMLLNHTSGIPDHAQTSVYFQDILDDPSREWSRAEQLEIAMDVAERIGDPGERFSYSDTGYILVGAMIEKATDDSLGSAVRALAYPNLGLLDIWWEALEPEPDGVSERFDQQAFGGPLLRIHPSVDLYGGGGLVSTVGGLAYFHAAAAKGDLLDDPALNAALITPTQLSRETGNAYGMGFFVREYAGETCYEHSGFWGTLAVYCPETNVTVTSAVTDAEAGFRALRPFTEAAIEAVR